MTVMLPSGSIELPRSFTRLLSGGSVRRAYIKTLRIHLVQKLPKLHSLQLVEIDLTTLQRLHDAPMLSLDSSRLAWPFL